MMNCFTCTRGWLRPLPAFHDGFRCLTTRGSLAAAHGTNIKKRTQRRKPAAAEDTGQPQGVSFQTDNAVVYYCAKFRTKIVDVRINVYRGYRHLRRVRVVPPSARIGWIFFFRIVHLKISKNCNNISILVALRVFQSSEKKNLSKRLPFIQPRQSNFTEKRRTVNISFHG